MSDQPSNGQDPQAGANALPINVLVQYVKDFSFENPNAPQSLLPNEAQPQVNIGVDVGIRAVGEDVFEVMLNLRAEAKAGETATFLVDLSYGGLFQLVGVPEEHRHAVLFIEGARLLFPFARSIVADATRDGGYPPLMINPIDFTDLYRRKLAELQAQQDNQPQQPPF